MSLDVSIYSELPHIVDGIRAEIKPILEFTASSIFGGYPEACKLISKYYSIIDDHSVAHKTYIVPKYEFIESINLITNDKLLSLLKSIDINSIDRYIIQMF